MFKWKVSRLKTLINLKCKVFHRNLRYEKTCQRYCSTKTKLLKINPNCIRQNKIINVYGLPKVQCIIQSKRILILWSDKESKSWNLGSKK